jgi:hypothetical protein
MDACMSIEPRVALRVFIPCVAQNFEPYADSKATALMYL